MFLSLKHSFTVYQLRDNKKVNATMDRSLGWLLWITYHADILFTTIH